MSPIDSYLGSSKRDDLTFSTYKTHVTGDLPLALCSRTEMRGMDGIWFAKLKLQHFREKLCTTVAKKVIHLYVQICMLA